MQDAKAPKHAKAQFQNLSLNKIHDLRFLQFLLTLYVANQAVCSVGDQEHQGYEEAARRRRRWRHFSKLHSRTLAKVSGQRACLSFCVALALALHTVVDPSSIYSWFLKPLYVLHSQLPTKKSWVVAYFWQKKKILHNHFFFQQLFIIM